MRNQSQQPQVQELLQKLRDPLRMRVAVAAAAAAFAYFAVFTPLDAKIQQVRRSLSQEQHREDLSREVELLRARFAAVESRLGKVTDVNESVQYILRGVRAHPLKLVTLDVDHERKVGPYRAVVLKLHVTGDVVHLDALLEWLENNERLFRVDALRFAPARGESNHRSLELTLLALKA